MTRSDPPYLALALLHRFLDDHEPLAGDLVERFAAGQSRLWFWREVLAAIIIRTLQRRRQRAIPRQINLTASPLPGVGGLSFVALGVLVALVRPGALWVFVPALAGGVVLGFTMVLVRRPAPGVRSCFLHECPLPDTGPKEDIRARNKI